MLSNIIDDLYKSLENNDKFDIPHLEEGSNFIRKLIEDIKNYNHMVKSNCVSTNKLGWLTSIPFPVTVEVINREQTPGKKVHVNMGYERIVIVYYGVSLELESFVNIVLWPTRELSNTSNQAYKKIYELVTKDKNGDSIIKFEKGFDLELSNSIHPSHSQEITTIRKPRYVSDWEHVPFFKETGDTIFSHTSPLNFRKVMDIG